MEKLAAYVVREGALTSRDAVGWILRLSTTLAPIHGLGVAHGRVSAKAIQIASPGCDATGFLLDAGDLADDPAYQSPERLHDGRPTPEDDCWAIGVTLYSVLSGQLPFRGTTSNEVLARIDEAPPAPLAVFDLGDDELQAVLDRLLERDPSRRMRSLDELRAALAAWDRSLTKMPALRFGKPSASADDDFDEDEAVMTAVYQLRGDEPPRGQKRQRPAAGRPARSDAIPHDTTGAPRPLARGEGDGDGAGGDGGAEGSDDDEVATSIRIPEDVGARAMAGGRAPATGLRAVAMGDERAPATEAAPPSGGVDAGGPHGMPGTALGTSARGSADLDHPSSSSPVVSSSSWPPKRDVVLAEAHADTVRRRQRLVLVGALLVGAVGGAVYMTVFRPKAPAAGPSPAASTAATSEGDGAPPAGSASTDGDAADEEDGEAASAADGDARDAADGDAASAADRDAGGAPDGDAADGGDGDAGDSADRDSADGDAADGGAEPAPSATADGAAASGGTSAGARGDVERCALELFPDDTFVGADPDFDFACTLTNPVAGASQLRQLVVASRGDRGVTHGMREWAMMGWYGMAAFTVLRARCCETPPPLSTPTSHTHCLLDERLEALASAVKERKEIASQTALQDYGKSVYCLVNSGASKFFDQTTAPRGGSLETFGKTLARAMKP